MIEEPPPSVAVGERDASLSSFLELLNEIPYDCQALIDERLLGHFCLSPQVEPLEESGIGADIMFSKYLPDYAARERGAGTPSRSPRGTLASSGSKGQRPMSPPTRITSEGSAKRTRASSLGTPPTCSSKPSATPPPPPLFKDEKGSPPSHPEHLGQLYNRPSSKHNEGRASSLALTLMRGVVTLKIGTF
ncbi:UNVERIFIED_CONTAM: hypothetical protein Sradi_4414600 [Sesamum radiatum]|uniref:Uncharacterized protein n=1 Tax=Sesamum radiatum TaxID=300843 RepID=A0AAW2NSK4_SESRA